MDHDFHPTPPSQGPIPPPSSDVGATPGRPHERRRSLRRWLDVLLVVSLTLNAVGLTIVVLRVNRKGGMHYLMEQLDLRDARFERLPFQVDWEARLRKLPDSEGEIVFAGDSIIAAGPWAELYSPIKNRGIGGETSRGLLDRLDEITSRRPRKLFILIGTNCLAADLPIAQVVRNYRKILERVRKESPETSVYVISVLPVNQVNGGPVHDNGSIRKLNALLKDLVAGFEGVTFIDVYDKLVDGDGNLNRKWTGDGLHLNQDGYLVLGRLLEPYVADPPR